MQSTATLTGAHLRTYQTIFRHPAAHNLGWQDVHALFRHLGRVADEPNGSLKVTRNGRVLILRPSSEKDVAGTDELLALRHFLDRSSSSVPSTEGPEAQWLLVIDHHEARIFNLEAAGRSPQQVPPPPPEAFFRHAHNSRDFSRGKEKPDPNTFFEPVARAFVAAGPILIFGTGTGMSSEMEQFTAWAKVHHPELAKRIIGAVVVDEHHLTSGQLLAKAREFFATPRLPLK
jgi:hypothetical protein